MPYCYYTCNLIPAVFLARSGYEPQWFGIPALDEETSERYDSPNVHPMTCPFVTRLVTVGEKLLAQGSGEDRVVVPGGCDAMRRAGELLAAQHPAHVRTLRLPRLSDEGALKELTQELEGLAEWLEGAAEHVEYGLPNNPSSSLGGVSGEKAEPSDQRRGFDLPSVPRPGGVFVVGGPMSDDSLLKLIEQLGARISGVDSCTAPARWRALDAPAPGEQPSENMTAEDAARLILGAGVCPRRSLVDRREYLDAWFREAQPSSVIYVRQSFCDPGAYDALLVAELAAEQGLPFLEVEAGFPLEVSGPLRTRVEAFLEAQLLGDDLLADLDEEDW